MKLHRITGCILMAVALAGTLFCSNAGSGAGQFAFGIAERISSSWVTGWVTGTTFSTGTGTTTSTSYLYVTGWWDARTKETYNYDAQGRMTDIVFSEPFLTNDWTISERYAMEYERDNQVSQMMMQTYSGLWNDSVKFEIINNADGLPANLVISSWNENGGIGSQRVAERGDRSGFWYNFQTAALTYDELGLPVGGSRFYNQGSWYEVERAEQTFSDQRLNTRKVVSEGTENFAYAYDSGGALTSRTRTNETNLPTHRNVYTYNPTTKKLAGVEYCNYDGVTATPYERDTLSYWGDDLKYVQHDRYNGASWIPVMRQNVTYTDEGDSWSWESLGTNLLQDNELSYQYLMFYSGDPNVAHGVAE